MDVVRGEQHRAAPLAQQPADALAEEMRAHLGVHRGEDVVEQVHVGLISS